MNFKSFFSSIGIIFSNFISPLNVSAAGFGDTSSTTINQTLFIEPSFDFDTLELLNTNTNTYIYTSSSWRFNEGLTLTNEIRDIVDATTQSNQWQNYNFTNVQNVVYTDANSSLPLGGSAIKAYQYASYSSNRSNYINVNGDEVYKFYVDSWLIPYRGTNVNTQGGGERCYTGASSSTCIPNDLVITFKSNELIIPFVDMLDYRIFSEDTSSFGTNSIANEDNNLDWQVSFDYSFINVSERDENNQPSTWAFVTLNYSYNGSSLAKNGFKPFEQFYLDYDDEITNTLVYLSNIEFKINPIRSNNSGRLLQYLNFSQPFYYTSDINSVLSFESWLIENDLSERVDLNQDCPVCSICPGTDINISYTDWLTTAIGGFFDFELFPGFSFGGVIAIVFILLFVIWVLKIIAGG